MIQLMAEWRRNTTFNGQHDHPHKDENWVLISFAVKKFNINYVVLSMKTCEGWNQHPHLFIPASLPSCKSTKQSQNIRFDRTISSQGSISKPRLLSQPVFPLCLLLMWIRRNWLKAGQNEILREMCDICLEYSQINFFFLFEVMEPQTILLSSQKPISSEIFLNGCAVSTLPSCFRVS